MTEQSNIEPQTGPQVTESPEVQNELSKVAANPKQSIFILVIICGIFIYIFFNLFISNKKSATEVPIATPSEIAKPIEYAQNNVPEIPKLPELPKLELPSGQPPQPPVKKITALLPPLSSAVKTNNNNLVALPPNSTNLPVKLVDNDERKRRLDAKRKSPIALLSGINNTKTPDQLEQEIMFQDRGNMAFVLGQGKIVDAILETAINSDFGGEVRAIISRDVFSEQEKVILIPKGSKVFGTYAKGDTTDTYGRISIIWNRIDLSNGYIINLAGTTVDNLGRKGEQGRVDPKFKERIANAILVSAFNIGIANVLDKIIAQPAIQSQAATTNADIATNIQNLALNINAGHSEGQVKIEQICGRVLGTITDKTSTAYSSMFQACTIARNPIGSSAEQRLAALMMAVNSAASSLVSAAATAATLTHTQTASKQAFTDMSNTIKDMIPQQQFKPTTTIDQGTKIKIYVNKNYKFPKAVLQKSRLIQ